MAMVLCMATTCVEAIDHVTSPSATVVFQRWRLRLLVLQRPLRLAGAGRLHWDPMDIDIADWNSIMNWLAGCVAERLAEGPAGCWLDVWLAG